MLLTLCSIALAGCRSTSHAPAPPLPLPAAQSPSWCVILCVADRHSWTTPRLDPWADTIPKLHRLFEQDLGIPPEQIVEWRNPDAARFLQGLAALGRMPLRSRVMLYLAAHHRGGRVLMNRGTAIRDGDLKHALNAAPALHWFVFDACYAAAIEDARPAFRSDLVRWYAADAGERAAGIDRRYRNYRLEALLRTYDARLQPAGTSWFGLLFIAGAHRLRLRPENTRDLDLDAWFAEIHSLAAAVHSNDCGTDLPVPLRRGPAGNDLRYPVHHR